MIDYISQNLWLFWTIITVVCLIMELSSGDFYVTCFALGALVSICLAVAGLPFWVQVIAWAVCSVLSIWLIRLIWFMPSIKELMTGKAMLKPSWDRWVK